MIHNVMILFKMPEKVKIFCNNIVATFLLDDCYQEINSRLSANWVVCCLVNTPQLVIRGGRKCLFNDTLNTFYLRLYGVGYMA